MSSETMVFGAAVRRSEKWRVFQIRTANSTWELELQSASDPHARRCAVLTRVAPESSGPETFTDSAPLADGHSLFALSPMEWMGKRLSVGTARTSEVQSVDFIGSAERPAARDKVRTEAPRRAPATAPQAEAKAPGWSPFPLREVEMAETAAALLKHVVHRGELFAALKGDSLSERRLTLALAECRLMLEALSRRG